MGRACGAKTDVGLKRSQNEDSLYADHELGLYVVCDGLGGHNAGEVASRLAVEVIQKHMWEAHGNATLPLIGEYERAFSLHTNRLASAIRLANQVIYSAAKSQPAQEGMGTTVVSAALNGSRLSVAHVGDSRLYLVREQTIRSLTTDHTVVKEQVLLTRALGIEESVEVDLDERWLARGDVLLLCSDGLTRGVRPPEILDTICRACEPQAACERLVELANAAGGEDNTTVVLITTQDEWQPPKTN